MFVIRWRVIFAEKRINFGVIFLRFICSDLRTFKGLQLIAKMSLSVSNNNKVCSILHPQSTRSYKLQQLIILSVSSCSNSRARETRNNFVFFESSRQMMRTCPWNVLSDFSTRVIASNKNASFWPNFVYFFRILFILAWSTWGIQATPFRLYKNFDENCYAFAF